MPAVLWLLPEQVCLQGEDVIEHSIDAPTFEPVIDDDSCMVEVAAERGAELTVDARLPSDLCFLQQLQTPVERELS